MLGLAQSTFECPICFDEAIPFVTSCGHNFCNPCLVKLDACPECREKFSNGQKKFQKNYALITMMQSIKDHLTQNLKKKENVPSLYSTNVDWENMVAEDFIQNIYLLEWRFPTQVQAEAIPIILSGKNLIIESWNGTGKTGSFVVGTLSKVLPDLQSLQVISISHTKEVKDMHWEIYQKVAKNSKIVVGRTVKYVKSNDFCHVLCGTVDSIVSYYKRNNLDCRNLTIVVDECDIILDNEYHYEKLKFFLTQLSDPQILLYSATLSEKTREFASNFANFEEKIVKSPDVINPKIKVFNLNPVAYESKPKTIQNLLKNIPFNMCLVFINTKIDGEILCRYLMENGYKADCFNGDLDDLQRETLIEKAKSGHLKVLLCTDVLGRGFDCKQIDLVINYECPRHPKNNIVNFESFYHRCGRTGRHTRSGTVINIINKGEQPLYNKIFQRFKINPRIASIGEIVESVRNNIEDYENPV